MNFLNSPFGLFLLSTVFISSFSWVANEVRSSQVARQQHVIMRQKLGMEIVNRLRYIHRLREEIPYNDYHTIEEAINGFIIGANVNQSHIPHYGAVFPEFQSRSFVSLIWEVESLSPATEKSRLRAARLLSEQLDTYVPRLRYREVPAPGRNPEGKLETFYLSPEDLRGLDRRVLSQLQFLRDPDYYETR